MQIKDGKLLYHLTTIDCFESIVQYGLLSRNALNKAQLEFTDTANHEILIGRDRLGLESFIPFHFHIYTRYDTYVKDNNKDKEQSVEKENAVVTFAQNYKNLLCSKRSTGTF